MNRLSIFALAFAGANASLLNKRQDNPPSDVCSAVDENEQYDMNLPCNQIFAIQYECMYGPREGDGKPHESDETPAMLPIEAQRVCICQSQHNDAMKGCSACHRAHGGAEGEDWVSDSKIDEVMDKYCDVGNTPTESYAVVIYDQLSNTEDTDDSDSDSDESKTSSDPIGTATDVSLYFTPAFTGTSAYSPGLPTGDVGNMTYTSSRTSDGLIVPTAGGSEKEGSSSGEEASSSGSSSSSSSGSSGTAASSDSGAMQTAMAHPGALGALGFAAMIAAL
jgi:hypothetical protein